MTDFETLVNPPQKVFEEIVRLSGESDNWSYQLGDYKFRSENYDHYWLIVVVEKATQNVVASITLARDDSEEDGPLFSIGIYYCTPKYRGQGHAKQLFQQVMNIIGDNNAFLAGNHKMSAKYASGFGFDKVPEHWHMSSSIKLADLVIPEKVSEKYTTKEWTEVDYEALTAYDRTICSRDRKKIMTGWFNLKDTFTRVVLDTSNNIVGYSTFRIVTMNKLNPTPFYADNLEAAEVLLKDMLNMVPNWQQYARFGFLYADCNKDPLRLLEKFARSKELVSTCLLYRSQFTKKFIPSPDQKVYCPVEGAHQFV